MPLYETNTPGALKPNDYGPLILDGLKVESIALASGIAVVPTVGASFRAPRITADPTAKWAAEGDDLTTNNPVMDEVVATPRKVGAAILVSRELAQDSSPAAAQMVGNSLARSLAVGLDRAFFTNVTGATGDAKAPLGLAALTGFTAVNVTAANFTNLDVFTSALVRVQAARGQVRAWYLNPADFEKVALFKTGTGAATTVLPLNADPAVTAATPFAVLGVPAFLAADIPAGTIYGVDTTRVLAVVRDGFKVETDSSVRFLTDEVAVKATGRLDIAFTHAPSVAKIVVA